VKNNTIRSRDLRNNDVRSTDVRDRTLTGRDLALDGIGGNAVKESELGKVPSAASADSALTLGGLSAAGFVQGGGRLVTTSMDVPSAGPADRTVVDLPGLGELLVPAGSSGCDEPEPALGLNWRNESGSAQDTWFAGFNGETPPDGPALPISHGAPAPGEEESYEVNGIDQYFQLRVQPALAPASGATISVFAEILQAGDECRISAQALVSG
jgi:hypothetical protein